jgi:error-prone DNA polymerase
VVKDGRGVSMFCNNCAHEWRPGRERFQSVEGLIARTGANREELSMLAEIGALNSFGYTRREALWQVERAVRPSGEIFEGEVMMPDASAADEQCPLPSMSPIERVVADYDGTGLTIGPHPMALRRAEMSLRGALRAVDLSAQRDGRRVRVAGAVITRQRPGTAKGFVFLTIEDETGIANIIVRPDVFEAQRRAVIDEPFLLVEGVLQNQEGVTSVKADRMEGLAGTRIDVDSRDFH